MNGSPEGTGRGEADQSLRALREAWEARPASEVAEFARRLARQKSPPPVARPALKEIRELAAVSGAVRPADLVGRKTDPDLRAETLGGIAAEFDQTVVDGRTAWTMRSAYRAATLRRLASTVVGLADALRRAEHVKTDPAGHVLRRLLAEEFHPDPDDGRLPGHVVGEATTAEVAQALLWAGGARDFSAIFARTAAVGHVESILRSYEGLLAQGVIGREREREVLKAFIEAETAMSDEDVPVLTLTGVGGTGKSTLLGEVLRPRLTALVTGRGAPAVVVIDLDRVAFRPDAEVELSFDVTRQLEVAWPELAGYLARARVQETWSRARRRELGSTIEGSSRSSASLEWRVGELLRNSSRAGAPVLLVLDTFEEWQRARPFAGPRDTWNDPEAVMAEWLDKLRRHMGLSGLRVVVSGRATFSRVPSAHIELGELDAAPVAELLIRLGVGKEVAPRLAAQVGGNPLTLHVAARFVGRLDSEERARFLDSDAMDTGLGQELRRAVLYDRFLAHIGDDRVRRLAHPGLVLRRVTPELVREVLAGPCGFPEMTTTEAADLVDRLVDEVWLVRRAADGSVRHVPEVRRAMLALMARDPDARDRILAIHARAADWYHPQDVDVMEPATTENVEAYYHRLMLETEHLTPAVDEWNVQMSSPDDRNYHIRFARELGESVSDLAPAVEAQLRLLRGDRLEPAQAALLPDGFWAHHVEVAGASFVELGEPEAAVGLLLHRPWPSEARRPEWVAQAFCDSARWDEFAEQARASDLRPSDRHEFVNLIVSEDEPARQRLLHPRSPGGGDQADELLGNFFLALGQVATGRAVADVRTPVRPGRPDRKTAISAGFPVDQLRQYAVCVLTGARLPWNEGAALFRDVAGLLVPDPGVMRAFGYLTLDRAFTDVAQELDELAERARAARPGAPGDLRSHDVLGGFAGRIARRGFEADALRRPIRPDALTALRGDNPELRPAIRKVLHEVAPGDDWLKSLGELATGLLPIPVADLRPDDLPFLSESGARSAFVTLVEYVDRSRVMSRFLSGARERHPDPWRLDGLIRAFDRWDDAHRTLLEGLTAT
ncbi:AAA family ATPase [Streptomyces flavochromogenes]|uniref:AAA family ATPase n=1 Tax=Streptomyces flavochromogenes TaxID=68199 RepID=UPI0004BF1193|nr:ATP-binding protein [Streptomyces flavochromogenes]